MRGPSVGEWLWVVVYRIANGSGDPLGHPVDDLGYTGKNIHVRPAAEVGDVVEIEVDHTSPMHAEGEIVDRYEETVDNPRPNKLSIRRKNDYTVQWRTRVRNVRRELPNRP